MYPMNSLGLLGTIKTRIKSARRASVGPIIIALTVGLAIPSHAETLWYNGDFAPNSFGVLNGINMTFEGQFPTPGMATVYDDFNVPAGIQGWHIDTLWSNDLMTFTGVTEATWSIRTNLSSGDAGMLIASGTTAATQTPTGRSFFEFTEFTIQVSGLAVDLVPGTYWLAVTPHGFGGPQASLISITDGLNSIGSPPGNNGNSFLDSPLLGADFEALDDIFFLPDFSMGVAGRVVSAQVVPEPASIVLTAFGVAILSLWASAMKRSRRHSGTLRGDGLSCAVGPRGGRRLRMAPYVTGTEPTDGATAAGGRLSCTLPPRRAICHRVSTGELPPMFYSRNQDRWRQPRVLSALSCSALEGV